MTEQTKAAQGEPEGLAIMRKPFEKHQISKLPKPTKRQTDEVRADYTKGVRCGICGGWHHPQVVHLDYVGHAALTDRLLDCDPSWNWEPISTDETGGPALDKNGGMWIRLTVCGVTRLGYGHPDGKSGGDAIKEVIGDALRNAAMRFGAALDLWHKGDLHAGHDDSAGSANDSAPHSGRKRSADAKRDRDYETIKAEIEAITTPDELKAWGVENRERINALPKAFSDPIRDCYAAHMEDIQSWISETDDEVIDRSAA